MHIPFLFVFLSEFSLIDPILLNIITTYFHLKNSTFYQVKNGNLARLEMMTLKKLDGKS